MFIQILYFFEDTKMYYAYIVDFPLYRCNIIYLYLFTGKIQSEIGVIFVQEWQLLYNLLFYFYKKLNIEVNILFVST